MLKKIKSLFARKNKSKSSEYAWNSPNYVPTYAGGFGAANRNMLNTW